MQTVSVGEQKLLIKPARLINYIEKVNFIRSRRVGVWDLLRQLPKTFKADTYQSFVREAMNVVYTGSSSVGVEEELAFDNSPEGFYWTLWRCMEQASKAKKTKGFFDAEQPTEDEAYVAGIQRAKQLWDSATDDEKQALRLALLAVEVRPKNSDGPPSDLTTGPESSDQSA